MSLRVFPGWNSALNDGSRRLDVLSDAACVSVERLPAHPCSDLFRSQLLTLIPAHADSCGFRKALVDFHGILVGEAAPARFGLRAPAYCVIREAEALYVGKEDHADYARFVAKLRRLCDALIRSAPRIPGETDDAFQSRKAEMHAEKESFFRCARNHKQRKLCSHRCLSHAVCVNASSMTLRCCRGSPQQDSRSARSSGGRTTARPQRRCL